MKTLQLDFSTQISGKLLEHASYMELGCETLIQVLQSFFVYKQPIVILDVSFEPEKAYNGLQGLLIKNKCVDAARYASVLAVVKADASRNQSSRPVVCPTFGI